MKTVLTTSPVEAASIIRSGGVVAFPTETVYGLGADVFSENAIRKIFDAKQRPPDNPLIAHVGKVEQIHELAASVSTVAERLIEHFFPGPLTIVLPKSAAVPFVATAGLDTIGIRMPGNIVAREFLIACDVPVVAPSANLSGRPSPTTWKAVFEDLNGRIDGILQGDQADIGIESTVIDCTSDSPVVLRKGAVSLAYLQRIVPEITEVGADDEAIARSPGLRHKHYSPRAKVKIVETGGSIDKGAFIGLHAPNGAVEWKLICGSVDEYARSLFEFFRECDRRGIETIFCEAVDEEEIGAALMDRIRRAASAT